MIAAKTTFTDTSKRVHDAVKKAKYKNFSHAAASIRRDAIKSIRKRKDKKKASPEGTPPFTHSGQAKRGVFFDVSATDAVIGFKKSVVGLVMATHEEGLVEEGRDYPERPTMGPALERNIERFHRDWRSSI